MKEEKIILNLEFLGMAFIIQELGDSHVMVGRWWGRCAVLFVDVVYVVGP
jgi:hypothetical protein